MRWMLGAGKSGECFICLNDTFGTFDGERYTMSYAAINAILAYEYS